MESVKILSGGAAQGLVQALAPRFRSQTGLTIEGQFGAVGAMAAKLRAGEPADLLILTSAAIAELAREGRVAGGMQANLGSVQTGIAIRAGDPAPAIANPADLRRACLEADAIYFPDPQQATAGIHFAGVLRALGIWHEVEARLKPFPNGATAMRELAAATASRPLGCTQVTEILITAGVTLVGPLPKDHGLATIYTAAVSAAAKSPDPARRLLDLLTDESSRPVREQAGFD